MLSPEESIRLSELLFPTVTETLEDAERTFPQRSQGFVTRMAPSPTGFLHVGALYMTLINAQLAHQNHGVFFLRIEDTDDKRETETGVEDILSGLAKFGVKIDEGAIGENRTEIGAYGPYVQSERVRWYHIFAKHLVQKGLAYPCFLTEDESKEIRDSQSAIGKVPGIYGNYSPWRNESFENIQKKLEAGAPYVLRFHAPGIIGARVTVQDEIRGKIEMDDNFLDIVVLKKNGVPTYHFAHVVDDYLMRTTHVIRAEEWLPSIALHYQLFHAFGFTPPKYAHTAQLMKIEDGNKRKLSKRKDPEANVTFFFEAGYPVNAIKNYLCGILDSGFEDWKHANPDTPYSEYQFDFSRMPKSGALFDLKKLDSVSNIYLSHLSNEALFAEMLEWAREFRPELYEQIIAQKDLAFRAVSIQRHTDRDPKKFTKLSDIEAYLNPFLTQLFEAQKAVRSAIEMPVAKELAIQVLENFLATYNPEMSATDWLANMKETAASFKFARDNAEFKAGGCVAKFGDYAMMIRVAVAAATNSPDLYEMMQVLDADETRKRIAGFIAELKK